MDSCECARTDAASIEVENVKRIQEVPSCLLDRISCDSNTMLSKRTLLRGECMRVSSG